VQQQSPSSPSPSSIEQRTKKTPPAEQCKIFAGRNSHKAAQISPEEFYHIYREKKKVKRQPLKILIPKEDEESLNQRHTRVTMVQIETTGRISRTLLERCDSSKRGN